MALTGIEIFLRRRRDESLEVRESDDVRPDNGQRLAASAMLR